MVGKWHLCPDDEMNLASTRRNWPTGRGFERFYGFLGAETNQWYPDLVYDNHPVDQPTHPGGGLPLHRGHHRQGARVHQGRQGDRARTSRSSCTTRRAPATRRTTRRRSGSTATRAGSTWATRRCASRRWPARRRWASSRRTPSCRRSTRSARPRPAPGPTASRSRRWTTPARGTRCPTTRSGCSAGWPRSTRGSSRTPTTRSVGCWTTSRRPASARTRWSSWSPTTAPAARAARTARSTRTKFANGIPDDIAENLAMLDELGGPKTYNHYPNGWAMAFNTPFKMWKRYEFNGGTCDPCIISWPAGIDGAGRDPRPVPPRDRPRARRSSTCSASSRPRRSRATSQSHFDGVSMRYSFDAAALPSAQARRSSTRCSARAAIWHDGWKAVTTHPTISGWSHFNEDDVGALPHRRRPLRAARPRRRASPSRLRELVNLWYAEAGANGAFPLDDRSAAGDPHHAAAAALAAARPLRLLPGHRRGARVAGGQHPQPLLRDRRARRHPGARRRRACCSRTARASAATPSTSRTTGCTTSTTSSAASSRRSSPTEDLPTGENLILSAVVRQGRRGPARRRRRHPLALPRRQEGRRGPHQDPARQVLIAGEGLVRRPRQRRPGHRATTPATAPWASPAARSTASPSTSAASPTSTSNARPQPCCSRVVRAERMEQRRRPTALRATSAGATAPARTAIRASSSRRGDRSRRVTPTTSGRGAGRRVRQRRHAVVREADADPARLHPAPARRMAEARRGPARRASPGRPPTSATTAGSAQRDDRALRRRRHEREGARGRRAGRVRRDQRRGLRGPRRTRSCAPPGIRPSDAGYLECAYAPMVELLALPRGQRIPQLHRLGRRARLHAARSARRSTASRASG